MIRVIESSRVCLRCLRYKERCIDCANESNRFQFVDVPEQLEAQGVVASVASSSSICREIQLCQQAEMR